MSNVSIHNYSKQTQSLNSTENEDHDSQFDLETSSDYILIQKIKNNKCLYNNKIKKTKEEKSKIWEEIALELNETVASCQKRWKRLREYFSKERVKRSSDNVLINKWPWYESMHFMDPFNMKKKEATDKLFQLFTSKKMVNISLYKIIFLYRSFKKKVSNTTNVSTSERTSEISSINDDLPKDVPIEEDDSHSLQIEASDNSEQPVEFQFIQSEFSSLLDESPFESHTSSPVLDEHSTLIGNVTQSHVSSPVLDKNSTSIDNVTQSHASSPVLDKSSTSIDNVTESAKISSSPKRSRSSLHQSPLANITAAVKNKAVLKKQVEDPKKKYKDEENNAIAELVTKHLQKQQDENKKEIDSNNIKYSI